MVIFVAVSIFSDKILYFVPEMWEDGRTEYLLSEMLFLLISVLPAIMVSHK